jgi:primase-polymerase (primpol)-like protein
LRARRVFHLTRHDIIMNNEIARLMQSIIPTGFEHYPQFINYNLVPNPKFPGKFDKKPCNVRGVDIAAFNRANWLTPQQAVANFISGVGHGIGFVFSEYDPFWFIDLDGAFINGSWSDLARRVHERFPGAAFEISQSGKGLHIFGSGEVPEHRKRVKLEGLGELEFYTVGRFVALTGTNKAGDARLDFTAAMPRFIADFGLTPDPAVAEVVIHTAGL